MGEIVGAGLLAHVPTIVLPQADRLELNEGKEITLVTGLRQLREDVPLGPRITRGAAKASEAKPDKPGGTPTPSASPSASAEAEQVGLCA